MLTKVLATLASSKTGESVSANDHINYGQSSNDIIPTCIHISAAVEVRERLLPALEHLHEVILVKAKKVDHHIKTWTYSLNGCYACAIESELAELGYADRTKYLLYQSNVT
jgi:fumarate hydratase class II